MFPPKPPGMMMPGAPQGLRMATPSKAIMSKIRKPLGKPRGARLKKPQIGGRPKV